MTETLTIPKEVIHSSWKNIDYEPYGTNREEKEYISPEKVSKESISKIKALKLNQARGQKLLTIFGKNEKLAA